MSDRQNRNEPDAEKGAVEGDGRGATEKEQSGNTSMAGQNPHRTESRLVKSNDSDFPEPGGSPEHSGQQSDERAVETVDQDPGERQKENQSGEKDDPLAA
jgi:hypothetical protein